MLDSNNYCVVLAGGIGTRLWPFSRKGLPKQFLDFNNDGNTLLKDTVRRVKKLFPVENIIVSTNLDYSDEVMRQLPELEPCQVLREPTLKGTAPCALLAAYHIRDINPNANIVVVPSDLKIIDEDDYLEVVRRGMEFVDRNFGILTIGIKPTRPETRFGYIQADEEQLDGMFKVRTFTEKPEEKFARIFVESGEFYWNSGVLMWNVNSFLEIANECIPEIASQFENIFSKNHTRDSRRSLLYSVYDAFPRLSLDYGILEKSEHVYMEMGNFRWNDIESWDLLHDYCAKDEQANAVNTENHQLYNCGGNMVVSNNKEKLVVIDGLSDYLVVDTEDVLLICKRDNEDDFKRYVNDVMMKYGEKYR